MESLKQLSRQEQDEFNRLKNTQNGVSETTIQLCLQYYTDYRKHVHSQVPLQKVPVLLRAALFMAQKSAIGVDINGQPISLPSLSVGQLLRLHSLDEVMLTLKELMSSVTISDRQIFNDLNSLVKQISFLITFHKKFEKSIEKMELRVRQGDSAEYLKTWVSFAWLMFVLVRGRVLGKSLDLIENTCTLAHTLAFMLSFGWDFVVPDGLARGDRRFRDNSGVKQVVGVIRQKVLDMFSIKTMEIYSCQAANFENYFESELVKKGVIKAGKNIDFLSPEFLLSNQKRLDKYYEKTMSGLDLDERVFLKQRTTNLTPSKFTPFARHGYANKPSRKIGQVVPQARQHYASHRILNYENIDKSQVAFKPTNEGLALGKLPKAVVMSPSIGNVRLISATPISTGMEMLNYINEKAHQFRQNLSQGLNKKRSHEGRALKMMETVLEKTAREIEKRSREQKKQMVYSFFKIALEQFLTQHPAQQDNLETYHAFMTLTLELVLYANNSAITFEDLERQTRPQKVELWKAADFFLNFDRSMPRSLKLHLIDIEAALISKHLLAEEAVVDSLVALAQGEMNKEQPQFAFIERILKRLLHQTAFQIRQLGGHLKLDEAVLEEVYSIMKQIITQRMEALEGRHLDQLIMCSIFAVSKKAKIDLKFVEILEAYKELNEHNRDTHEAIIMEIDMGEGQMVNIKKYYNDHYVKVARDLLLHAHQLAKKPNQIHPAQQNPILMSPLKDILPREIQRSNIRNNKDQTQKDLLVAYTDSPLLRHQPITFKGKDKKACTILDYGQQNKTTECENPRPSLTITEPPKKISIQGNLPWKQSGVPSPLSMGNGKTPPRSKAGTPLGAYDLSQFNSGGMQSKTTTNKINSYMSKYSKPSYQ